MAGRCSRHQLVWRAFVMAAVVDFVRPSAQGASKSVSQSTRATSGFALSSRRRCRSPLTDRSVRSLSLRRTDAVNPVNSAYLNPGSSKTFCVGRRFTICRGTRDEECIFHLREVFALSVGHIDDVSTVTEFNELLQNAARGLRRYMLSAV